VKPKLSARFTRDIKPLIAKWLKESEKEDLLDSTSPSEKSAPFPTPDLSLGCRVLLLAENDTKSDTKKLDFVVTS
jgi:hypothetical protein